jgi:hypothetical protein
MEIYVALIGLIGLLLGAWLQSRFSNSNDVDAQLRLRRNEAYADYLEGVALAAIKGGSAEAKLRLISAKTRLSIYGANSVLEAMAALERIGPVFNTHHGREAFVQVVTAMRRDGLPAQGTLKSEVYLSVLFGEIS